MLCHSERDEESAAALSSASASRIDHFLGDARILNLGIPVSKAPPLLFLFLRCLNGLFRFVKKLLQTVCHEFTPWETSTWNPTFRKARKVGHPAQNAQEWGSRRHDSRGTSAVWRKGRRTGLLRCRLVLPGFDDLVDIRIYCAWLRPRIRNHRVMQNR